MAVKLYRDPGENDAYTIRHMRWVQFKALARHYGWNEEGFTIDLSGVFAIEHFDDRCAKAFARALVRSVPDVPRESVVITTVPKLQGTTTGAEVCLHNFDEFFMAIQKVPALLQAFSGSGRDHLAEVAEYAGLGAFNALNDSVILR